MKLCLCLPVTSPGVGYLLLLSLFVNFMRAIISPPWQESSKWTGSALTNFALTSVKATLNAASALHDAHFNGKDPVKTLQVQRQDTQILWTVQQERVDRVQIELQHAKHKNYGSCLGLQPHCSATAVGPCISSLFEAHQVQGSLDLLQIPADKPVFWCKVLCLHSTTVKIWLQAESLYTRRSGCWTPGAHIYMWASTPR